jgi:predicted transcriptional regulator
MEQKGLVEHRLEGRAFVYRPCLRREPTIRGLAARLLDGVFDGAVDQLVDCLLTFRKPNQEELVRLEKLITEARRESPEDGDEQPAHP